MHGPMYIKRSFTSPALRLTNHNHCYASTKSRNLRCYNCHTDSVSDCKMQANFILQFPGQTKLHHMYQKYGNLSDSTGIQCKQTAKHRSILSNNINPYSNCCKNFDIPYSLCNPQNGSPHQRPYLLTVGLKQLHNNRQNINIFIRNLDTNKERQKAIEHF